MKTSFAFTSRLGRLALASTAAAALAACASAPQFAQPDADFQGRVSVVETPVVYAGSQVKLAGSNFKPGQLVQFLYEGQSITGSPVKADAEGKFTAQTTIPAHAAPGRHPVVVSVTEPAAALVYPLKVSPNVPLSGAERFEVRTEKLVPGLYQSAYSARNNTVFVTSAVGRPPVSRSELVKLNADTLQIEKRVSPPEAPARQGRDGASQPSGLFAVYGVGVDDANGNVWVTVTRQNTVAVYRQSDLALVKQFEAGAVSHARDVVIDERHGKAFVSAARSPNVEVFDTKTLQKTASIKLESSVRGPDAQPFATMSLTLDAASGQLFVVSAGGEVAIINTATNAVEKVLPVKDAFSASGVAYDAATGHLFVAAQGSDNVVILDAKSGEVLQNVLVGAGALNVAFDPVKRLAYVSNRGSGTLTVLDADGNIVANLDNKPLPNHVSVGPNGVIYAVNKGPADHEDSDNIKRIQPK